jgi:hypothetical protein
MARRTDVFTGAVVLHPGSGERRTSTHWYRYQQDPQEPQEVIGAVTLDRLAIQTTSVQAFRELAELCTQVADRMDQMYAEAAMPETGEGAGR